MTAVAASAAMIARLRSPVYGSRSSFRFARQLHKRASSPPASHRWNVASSSDAWVDRPGRPHRHVVWHGRAIDERSEVRTDRRRQFLGPSEIRRDVGEVFDGIRVTRPDEGTSRRPTSGSVDSSRGLRGFRIPRAAGTESSDLRRGDSEGRSSTRSGRARGTLTARLDGGPRTSRRPQRARSRCDPG